MIQTVNFHKGNYLDLLELIWVKTKAFFTLKGDWCNRGFKKDEREKCLAHDITLLAISKRNKS